MAEDLKLARAAGFNDLGHGIYLKRLSPTNSIPVQGVETHPTVILLFGWMGAKLSHLLKVTVGYEKIYPFATQILVRSEVMSFAKPQSMQSAHLRPITETLKALGCITSLKGNDTAPEVATTKHRILLHVFSNGGCYQVQTLSKQLSQYSGTNVNASAIIFDSCPGGDNLSTSLRTFGRINFLPLRVIVIISVFAFYFYVNIRRVAFGIPPLLETIKAHIIQPDLLPWSQKNTPRLYIYSTTDNVVPWQEVESHVKDAERVCTDVRKERFEGSMHASHMMHDPDRYWRAVQDLWNAACQGHQEKKQWLYSAL